jgi:hypothetical protein
MTRREANSVRRFWLKAAPVVWGCWIWTGSVHQTGYGTTSYGQYVHRVAYRMVKGSIPPGLHIDHLCRNRLCINPDHLEAVTAAENNRRSAPFRRNVVRPPRPSAAEVAARMDAAA